MPIIIPQAPRMSPNARALRIAWRFRWHPADLRLEIQFGRHYQMKHLLGTRCLLRNLWIVAALVVVPANCAFSSERCDRALSYERQTTHGFEWRIFDPLSRADTLFLTLAAPPSSVFWDSSLTHISFQIRDTVYSADWKLGAHPRPVMRFPNSPAACVWWFNPDSARWQLLTKSKYVPRRLPGGSTDQGCSSELWQSSKDGMRWHMLLIDTTECSMEDCGISDGNLPRARHSPSVSSEELQASLELDEGSPRASPVYPDTIDTDSDIERFFAPSASDTTRGIEYGFAWASTEGAQARVPIYLVDRAKGTRQALCGPGANDQYGQEPAILREVCGLVLIYCGFDPPRLVDLATGRDLVLPASAPNSMMWSPALRP